jgi:CBS domain containing-hemolysin-like protein
MSVWVWIVIAILILANAFYVAAEFAAVGVRRSRVHRLAADGSWLAGQLLPYVEHPRELDRYVGASQVGITLSSLTLGAYGQVAVAQPLAPLLAAWLELEPLTALSAAAVIVLGVLTALQLVLGELVPKGIALQFPTETALTTVLPMRWSLVVFGPAIYLLNGAALRVLSLVGAEHGHGHLHSPEEIDLMIAESRDGGLLEPEEQQRLRRALHLGVRTARDLMVPIERLTILEVHAPWDDVVRVLSGSPFSRIPVYEHDRHAVVGMLRVKDLVNRYVVEGVLPLKQLMRPVVSVAPATAVDQVLSVLRARRMQSALVADERGRAVGLVTIQDVLTELLGASTVTPAVRESA